ncbi:MAG TPA: NYN domain-containing protein [Chloroflexota bacterium]|nr:NYN domain-containing protein [Chloroflexota bacterium]
MSINNPEESADHDTVADQPLTSEPPTRPRRFAPRRSRGAGSATAPVATEPEAALAAEGQPIAQLTVPISDHEGSAGEPVQGGAAKQPSRPSRPRRASDRRAAAKPTPASAARASEVALVTADIAPGAAPTVAATAAPTVDPEQDAGSAAPESALSVESVSSDDGEGAAPETALVVTDPPARVDNGANPDSPAAVSARPAQRRRPRPAASKLPPTLEGGTVTDSLGDAEAPEAIGLSTIDEIAAPRPGTPARPSRGRRARRPRPTEAAPVVEDGQAAPEAVVVVAEPDPVGAETTAAVDQETALTANLADFLGLSSREAETVGADLDGAELLANALREMFPPIDPDSVPPVGLAPVDSLSGFDFEAAAAALDAVLDALPDQLEVGENGADGEDAQHRRGRRGRRGGRGRRRNGLAMAPPLANAESQPAMEPPTSLSVTPEPEVPTDVPAPPVAAIAPTSPFTPEQPPRAEPSWRDQRPRRNWGRVLPRDVQPAAMPPPKPSSTRFVPIPQALPPVPASAAAPSPLVIPSSTPFTMPNLRADEPLGPGETRSERLLDVQTRLMAAMLEQQARQIDVLTASVSALYEAIQGIGAGGTRARASMARTAIFVDAPNVVYAAENARVHLDYSRMLKYLSRDRQLVHALSYSPIIDDVREGIRYETQRFVAPFLRAGYKLVTKPLKRFSDGSAKGNFDIELALDMLTMAERLDILVLVSGDSDFESVIEHIQSRGVRVEVVAFASNVSTELVNVADVFIDINQHIEHMRAL